MIISIAGQRDSDSEQIIAELVGRRSRAGRRVTLLDPSARPNGAHPRAQPVASQLEELLDRYNDVVIDITGCGGEICHPALISTQLVIVLLHVQEARLDKKYGLISQLNAARMFNPGLHVVFAVIAGESDPSPTEREAVRTYCAEVMAAKLCGTMIEPGVQPSLEALYKKVFEQQQSPSEYTLH
jgi:chromosome partitioning protein